MSYRQEYIDIAACEVLDWASSRAREGWQFVQLLATTTEDGIDVTYTLRLDDLLQNATVRGVHDEDHIPSITRTYLAAFVFENEIHDLFGVHVDGIAIDFEGKFYKVSQEKPMTIVSPEQLAAREKARKLAAAKAAKEAADAAAAGEKKENYEAAKEVEHE